MALRKITQEMTLDDVRAEVWFTTAALEADSDATDLLPLTETWESKVDGVETLLRAFLREEARTDAVRIGANSRLDRACEAFGDDLYLAVGKDRTSPRWLSFFRVPVHRFVRRALSDQVSSVGGWLETKDDAVVDKHREALTQALAAARGAIDRTAALGPRRGTIWQARATAAEELTNARDGLREALAARARERSLPRDWPDTFFRPARQRSGSNAAPVEAPTSTTE